MSARLFGAAAGIFAAIAFGAPCCAEPVASSFELVRPVGDVYNERTDDGDAYPQSLGLRASLGRDGYALTLDYRRNVYLTESRGPGSLTRYARIEGGYGTVVPFLARESAFEARFERRLRGSMLSVGLGLIRTWTNYHYPVLTGIGGGIELRAAASAGIRPFASAFYYPAASGPYTTENLPPQALQATFGVTKLEAGVVVNSTRSPVFWIFGYNNETRTGRSLAGDIGFIRSDPYVALGLRR